MDEDLFEELEDLLIGEEEFTDGIDDGVQTTADGCQVEPDGQCPHGHLSPYRRLGLI